MVLTHGSTFTGIGGFDLAAENAGIETEWQVENDKYCREVLNLRFGVKIHNDIKEIRELQSVDIISGGFPCQDVSVAGPRTGLAGERSGLWFEFARVVELVKPKWVVVENVPGLLSSNEGRDFATVLFGLAQLGYGVCYRVLDAQYFGVPQRRRRVFVVGSLGNGRSAEILFEQESSPWDTVPSRKKKEENTRTSEESTGRDSRNLSAFPEVSYAVPTKNRVDPETHAFILWEPRSQDGVPRFHDEVSPPLNTAQGGQRQPMVGVRRLTPLECERLQGFPDNWTRPVSDAQRYKQLGNAVCVPVAEWIFRRIVDAEEDN